MEKLRRSASSRGGWRGRLMLVEMLLACLSGGRCQESAWEGDVAYPVFRIES